MGGHHRKDELRRFRLSDFVDDPTSLDRPPIKKVRNDPVKTYIVALEKPKGKSSRKIHGQKRKSMNRNTRCKCNKKPSIDLGHFVKLLGTQKDLLPDQDQLLDQIVSLLKLEQQETSRNFKDDGCGKTMCDDQASFKDNNQEKEKNPLSKLGEDIVAIVKHNFTTTTAGPHKKDTHEFEDMEGMDENGRIQTEEEIKSFTTEGFEEEEEDDDEDKEEHRIRKRSTVYHRRRRVSNQPCREFLNHVDEESSKMYHSNALYQWNYESNITEENKGLAIKSSLRLARFQKKIWLAVKEFRQTHYCGQCQSDVARQFRLLSIISEAALNCQRYTKVGTSCSHLPANRGGLTLSVRSCPVAKLQETISDMEAIYSTAILCSYQNRTDCNLRLEPEVTDIMAYSKNPDELKYIWNEWRKATGKNMKNLFTDYIELINGAARKNGYPSAAEAWLEPYEDPAIASEVENLWFQLKPLYEQLHAYVRKRLRMHYGDKIVSGTGPIPAHLLGNMWGQHWNNLYNITVPYPKKKMADVTAKMREKKFTPEKMFREAEKFFVSLNMSALPDEFWVKSIIEPPKSEGPKMVCHASAWDMYDRKDFRIKMCTQVTWDDFIIVHHEMGHVQYYIQYKDQPLIFREGANPAFHEAIGDVMALSVSTPSHIEMLGLYDNKTQGKDKDDCYESDINFLFNMALLKVAFLPYGYLVDRWRWGVFRGDIPPERYNIEWWLLTEEYQGVGPPDQERRADEFDPGSKYHVAAGVPYLRYFISFVIQFQFHKALCETAGQFDSINTDSKPLHKCDIFGSVEAGELLKKMLQMGYSKPWPEAMQALTGSKEMDAEALLLYFRPLREWLEKENFESHEYIGWDKPYRQVENTYLV